MSAKTKMKKIDASLDVALNGIHVEHPAIAARLGVPLGTKVAWAIAFPVVAS